MKPQPLHFTLYAIIIYLTGFTLNLAIAASQLSVGNGTHFCGVIDDQWNKQYSDQFANRHARTAAANLNVGEPRTVRMIYFLPNDRAYNADVVQNMKADIRTIQTFYAEQMGAHGFGNTPLRIETDPQGEPIVHRMDGEHPDSHYLENTADSVRAEIEKKFDIYANIYFIVIDNSINGLGWFGGQIVGGVGGRVGKHGGYVLKAPKFGWGVAAHELGHAFGLWHDFRDGAYIMSYGPGMNRLSACHAEYLSVHPYFNSETPIERGQPPSIELISSHIYPAESKSVPVRLRISDSDELHQVFLYADQPNNRDTVKACRGLRGKNERVVDFDYDGIIPSARQPSKSISTSFLSFPVHPIHIEAVDVNGNVNSREFVLLSEALQPLLKISGDNQHGFLPNTPLPVPFVVEVRDLNDGSVRNGVPVTFTVTAGGGTLSRERTETNGSGQAESLLTLGPHLGVNTVEVSAAGMTVTFTAVARLEIVPNKITGPWLWMIAATAPGQGGAQSNNIDSLAAASNGNVTEADVAANGAKEGDAVGSYVWTLGKIAETGGNNINDIINTIGLVQGKVNDHSSYALITLESVTIQPNVMMRVGSDDSIKVWLNGEVVHNNSIDRWAVDFQDRFAVNLKEGDNLLLVKVSERSGGWNMFVGIEADVNAVYKRLPDTVVSADVNSDGSVNVLDLILIASSLGQSGQNDADVNGDRVVNILDLVLAAGMFEEAAAAPSAQSQVPETLTAVEVQGWLTDARSLEAKDPIIQRGFVVLEQLLVSLTPTETELLANYPNPFNPETWIPYRLAEDAFVTLTIYDGSGGVVRAVEVGHRIAAVYESQSKAIYWDGRNALGEGVASGVYFYHLSAGDYSATRKMAILK